MIEKLRLRGKMLVFILGGNILILSLMFGLYYVFSKKLVVNESQKKVMAQVDRVAAALKGQIDKKSNVGWTFSHDPEIVRWLEHNSVRNPDRKRDKVYDNIINKFQIYVKADGDIKSAFIASEKTQNYYESEGRIMPDDYFVGTRDWYKNAIALHQPCLDFGIDYIDKSIAVSYRYPIYNERDLLLGIGGIDFSLSFLDSYINKLVESFDSAEAYLLDSEGMFLDHPDVKFILDKKLADLKDKTLYKGMEKVAARVASGEKGIDRVVYRNEKRYFISTHIEDLDWTLLLSVPVSEINGPLRVLAQTSIIIIFITAAALFGCIFLMSRSISRPIIKLVNMVKDIAQGKGDLTKRLDIKSKDEVGELAYWFNLFMDKLHDIIALVKENADEISGATGNLSATASELASGANAQNTQATEVASSVQQMAAVIVQNAQSATSTAVIAQEACDKANSGAEVMQDTQKIMDDIVISSEKTGSIVNVLSKRTIQIGEIIRIIDDIAVQTNLLALNAAIEASSAGENGKGFAVVAEEVRKLAVRTKEATKEIAGTILEIKRDTDQVSNAMDKSMLAIGKGKEATVKTEAVLQEIVGSVSEAMGMVQQIATGSEEQKFGAEEISRGMSAISNVTNESANGAEQMAAFARQLDTQSSSLKDLVSQFKLRNDTSLPA